MTPVIVYNCRSISMTSFAEGMRTMIGSQQYLYGASVLDKTDLPGEWDFDLKYTLRGLGGAAAADAITMFEAVEKQLGLKLEPARVSMPVIVVESVNEKPTATSPEAAESLLTNAAPTEFEVADVKPSSPDSEGLRF